MFRGRRDEPQRRSQLHVIGRLLAFACAGTLLWVSFRGVDGNRVAALIAGIPPASLVMILMPQLLALSFETWGWKQAFVVLGREVPFVRLLRVRLSTEALAQSLPAGAVVCESTKPLLLSRHCGLNVPDGVTGMAARKYLLLLSQSAYLLGVTALSWSHLSAASRTLTGSAWLPFTLVGSALTLLVAAWLLAGTFASGTVASRVLWLLERIPVERWRQRLEQSRLGFAHTDSAMARFFGSRRRYAPTLAFLGGWLCECVETWLILRVLGVPLEFSAVAGMEIVLSLVRNVLFVLPAGLGVQDVGYVAFLGALGAPDPLASGAAFVVLKRCKELFWIAVGYACLLTSARTEQSSVAGEVAVRFAGAARARDVGGLPGSL